MSSDRQTKAAQRGAEAGRKRQPRNVNPYPDSDKRHEVWDAAHRTAREEMGQ